MCDYIAVLQEWQSYVPVFPKQSQFVPIASVELLIVSTFISKGVPI